MNNIKTFIKGIRENSKKSLTNICSLKICYTTRKDLSDHQGSSRFVESVSLKGDKRRQCSIREEGEEEGNHGEVYRREKGEPASTSKRDC